MRVRGLRWIPFSLAALGLSAPSPQTPASDSFETTVRPFLAANCDGCHNAKLKTGGINLQSFTSASSIASSREVWEKVLQKMQSGEMPPKGMPRPHQAEVQRVTGWISNEFERQDNLASPDPGRITARRLNRAEYNNTVRDLLAVDFQPADDFPQDDSGYGFDNIGDVLSISPLLMEKYMAAAEKIARTAILGAEVKSSVARYQPPNRRRLEKNSEKELFFAPLRTPAPYTLQDYDITGLGQPSSVHINHHFPAAGDYVFHVAVGHNRPPGWDPLKMALWIDGKIADTTEIAPDERQVVLTGDREAIREFHASVPAGVHWVAATFLRQFEGVPASYGAPHPTKRVQPPPPPLPNAEGLFPYPSHASPEQMAEVDKKRAAFLDSLKQSPDTPDGIRVDWLDIVGPAHPAGPSLESRKRVFVCGHLDGNHQPGCERKIMAHFAEAAFRRPVTAQETERYLRVVSAARGRGRSFDSAVALGMQAILVSPDFLFRIERDEPNASAGSIHPISQYELASRLSYFLWSSMPDRELLRSAGEGSLRNPEVMRQQVRRMLNDPKANAFVENFTGQWLEIRRLESVKPDRERYPDFEDYLRISMRKETELFFDSVMREDRSILDFVNGQYTFLNERMARHYKIPGITGPEFRRVDLSGTARRGVLTQASVLTVSSYGNRTSPVLRGKWVLENLLNAPPPPPPPDVPNLDTAAVGSTASLRQQLEEHRKNPVCASCHSKMDPLGFALENFDAIGQWRTVDGKLPIDASGTLPNGKQFLGATELTTVLSDDPATFTRCLTEKMMIYALGRGLEGYDRKTVKEIASRVAANQYRFSSLVNEIVNSLPFQQRREGTTTNDRHS